MKQVGRLLPRTRYMVAVIGCLGLIVLMHHKVVAQSIDDEPNFLVIADGESEGLSIDLTLYRQNGRVSGFGFGCS